MRIDALVRMANDIGHFFDAQPDRDAALAGLADHLRKFWAPTMRAQLAARKAEPIGLDAFVSDALARHSITAVSDPLATREPRPVAERHDWDGASEA